MISHSRYYCLLPVLALTACTTVPVGPSVAVMPGYGKTFDQFTADDVLCRQYAGNQISPAVSAGNDSAVESGIVGTVVGAVAGGAIGGRQGAAVGAGGGLLVGTAAGVSSSQYAGYSAQRRYDISYEQCMYSKGNSVPGWINQTMPAMPPPPLPPHP